ncbi:MAG: hypothetical protein WKF30_08915 [Pyrinomonadaceae bacterium]
MRDKVPEPLADVLRTYCNVNALSGDWHESVRRMLEHTHEASLFKQQLADAILHRSISPANYERLTREDFDTPEDLLARLGELWRDMYGDEPVTLDDKQAVISLS